MSGRPVAIDLFAGVGGLSLGLTQAGFEVGLAVERDALAGRYAQFNHPDAEVRYGPIEGDVANLLTSETCTRFGGIDLVAGGPPCQGFSEAGLRAKDDPRNSGVGLFVEVVAALEPQLFLMENVPGILSRGRRELRTLANRLGGSYRISKPTLLLASDFGVPQARRRVFVLGVHRDLGHEPTFPKPTSVRETQSEASAWEAISDLPALLEGSAPTAPLPYRESPASLYARRMRGLEVDPTDKSRQVSWDGEVCFNVTATRHGASVRNRFAKLEGGQVDSVSRLIRIGRTGVSPTIRAGTKRDHGSRSAPRPIHPFEDRVLTPRECARIQSFPDWFVFHPSLWHGNMQIGNAVPPVLARKIGAHLVGLLGFSPRRTRLLRERDVSLIQDDFGDDACKLKSAIRMTTTAHPKKGSDLRMQSSGLSADHACTPSTGSA